MLLCRRCAAKPSNAGSHTATTIFKSPALQHHSRRQQSQRFSLLIPPPPSSLPKPTPAKYYRRTRKWLRRLLYLSAFTGSAILLDKQFNASSLTRSFRTFGLGILVGIDYKINFRAHPTFAESIEALHARNAQKLFDLLRTNGGLYLKIGQAIAMQSAILPPQFQKMFQKVRHFTYLPLNYNPYFCRISS